jgi:hypothetical protein
MVVNSLRNMSFATEFAFYCNKLLVALTVALIVVMCVCRHQI